MRSFLKTLPVAILLPGLGAAAPAPAPASRAAVTAAAPVFPATLSLKYNKETPGKARMHTCLDQYKANKATHANGGLKWVQAGGGYYKACSHKLKT